jgi:adenine-specific DNA-methyltransferase
MYATKTLTELRVLCKERGLRGYSGKSKPDVVALLTAADGGDTITHVVQRPIRRLNYIGSKFQLLDWICTTIREKTGWSTLAGHRMADLFAGTGVVSHCFRLQGASVVSNDAELYSSVIAHAFTRSTASPAAAALIAALQAEIDAGAREDGFVAGNYAPNPATGCERMFFTLDNARRIDYLRRRLEETAASGALGEDDHRFVLATLLLAADAVSNVPAVYGCYLKSFKERATRPLTLVPVHDVAVPAAEGSAAFHRDVLGLAAGSELDGVEAVYLDPPYNNRHYSKNYFPLNVIAGAPSAGGAVLRGKTGIPEGCFLSPFSASPTAATAAFEALFARLKAPWVFLSYSNEGTVSREDLEKLMGAYGEVTVVERDYARFKSFEYNETGTTKEYLFCLRRSPATGVTPPA